jgi:TolB protein
MDEGRPPDPAPGEAVPAGLVSDGDVPADSDFAMEVPTEEVSLEPRRPGRGVIAIVIVLVVAFVSFAVVGGTIISSPPAPTPRPEPRLAVIDAGNLRTMDAHGGAVGDYQVPGDPTFGFPAWSPDGTRIAVTGQDKDSGAVYVIDPADTGATTPTLVYDSPDRAPFYLYWSPDGRQIAFLTTEPDGIALRVAPADASSKARVVRKGAPLYWDWLGNDHLVAHIGLTGEGSFLGELDLDGEASGSVSLEPGFFRSPAVSHDGAYRGYVATNHDSTGIVTVESADQSHRETTRVFGVAAVSFDPTGTTLAYVGAERPFVDDPGFPLGPLRVMDPATGQTRTLLEGQVLAFFWSPDGKTIAALTLGAPGEQIVGVPGAALAAARGPTIGTEHGPDQAAGVALTLSFVDVASGSVRTQRAAQVTSTFVNNILPYYDQYALSHRIWAPDSSAIALPLVADGKDRLSVIPADGTKATSLDGAQLGFWSP